MRRGPRRKPDSEYGQRFGLTVSPPSLAVLTRSASAPKSGAVGASPTVVCSGFSRRFVTAPIDGNTRGGSTSPGLATAAPGVGGGCVGTTTLVALGSSD